MKNKIVDWLVYKEAKESYDFYYWQKYSDVT